MSKLLPYETIVKAHAGDPEAVNAVLRHYAGYIRYFSKVNGQEMALPLGRTGTVIGDVRLEGTASAVENDGFFEVFRERGGTHLFAGHDHAVRTCLPGTTTTTILLPNTGALPSAI